VGGRTTQSWQSRLRQAVLSLTRAGTRTLGPAPTDGVLDKLPAPMRRSGTRACLAKRLSGNQTASPLATFGAGISWLCYECLAIIVARIR
jgi:hypothetical protein